MDSVFGEQGAGAKETTVRSTHTLQISRLGFLLTIAVIRSISSSQQCIPLIHMPISNNAAVHYNLDPSPTNLLPR